MEFQKVHQIGIKDLFFHNEFNYDLSSNVLCNEIYFCCCTRELIVNEKRHKAPVPDSRNSQIYSITDIFHILKLENHSWHIFYLIKIDDKISFKLLNGSVCYIGKEGFMTFDICNDNAIYDYYDITKEKWVSRLVKSWSMVPACNKYFLISLEGDHINFYTMPKIWINDFQERNPDFLDVEKYYYQKEINYQISGSFSVRFKDGIYQLSALELENLKSEFIYEQSQQGEIFLDMFTFEDYKNQTYDFLDYIGSYILHIKLKERMIEDLK